MVKKYDIYGRQFTEEEIKADCTCISAPLKSALIKALVTYQSDLADQVRDKHKFLADVAVKGAEKAGEELSRRGSFDVVQFTRDVEARFGKGESLEEEKKRLRESTLAVADWKQNQWELYEMVRQLIIKLPTCEGKEPPMDVDWHPPHYAKPPWEKE